MIVAVVLTLTSALLNATWNVLLKTADDPLRTATRAVTLAVIAITPVVAVAWLVVGRPLPSTSMVLLAAGSALVELAYFICLSTAYRRGAISQVYPLARGSAPLLAALAGVLILRERLHGTTPLGIALLLLGIGAARGTNAPRSAVVPALLTGVCIASYSSLDSVGTRLGATWLYGWLLWVGTAAWLLLWALARRARGPAVPEDAATANVAATPPRGRTLLVGLLMTASYGLVLVAFRLAPLAVVAPLRESSIVLVTCWGVWRLDEREGRWRRVAGAVAILAGVLLLAR